MYKNILVPLDLSSRAEAILPHVEELARCSDARVIFLHVLTQKAQVLDMTGNQIELEIQLYSERRMRAENYLLQRVTLWRAKGIHCEYRVIDGHPVESIIEIADEVNADLIALASHGRSGLASVVYGSVATGLLHRINQPILVIKSVEKPTERKETAKQEAVASPS